MLIKTKTITAAAIMCTALAVQSAFAQTPQMPFPMRGKFNLQGTMTGPNRTPELLDQDVRNRYNSYKSTFLVNHPGGQYSYIRATGTGNAQNALTISEAHGYGMKIFALMAGHDPEAKAIFDRMNNFRRDHRSRINQRLMAWYVTTVGQVPAQGNSATDGDLDIAYALLLAHTQWGDEAYLTQARDIIGALRSHCMHPAPNIRPKLGDWHSYNWSGGTPGTDPDIESRSSDWRPSHFRAFARASVSTADRDFWNNAANAVYTLLQQSSHSSTGLMPDFVSGNPARAEPSPKVSGEHNMQHYSFNACRVPWFLALDYAHYGSAQAKTQADRISTWLRNATNQNPGNNAIKPGYQLNGTALNPNAQWVPLPFAAPFASGMMTNSANQSYLTSLYTIINGTTSPQSYDVAIQLLNMILISGNWWAPGATGGGGGDDLDCSVSLELVGWEWTGDWFTDGLRGNVIIEQEKPTVKARMVLGEVIGVSYPWLMLAAYFEEGFFSNLKQLEIRYRADRDIIVSINSKYEAVFPWGNTPVSYQAELKASPNPNEWVTVKLPLGMFEVPRWMWDEEWGGTFKGPVYLNDVPKNMITAGVVFSHENYEQTVNLEIAEIWACGVSGGTSIIPRTNRSPAIAGISIVNRNLNMSIPSERAVTVNITDVRGRLLFSKDVTLNSGVASLAIPTVLLGNQTLIVNIKGQNGLNVSRKMLLK